LVVSVSVTSVYETDASFSVCPDGQLISLGGFLELDGQGAVRVQGAGCADEVRTVSERRRAAAKTKSIVACESLLRG